MKRIACALLLSLVGVSPAAAQEVATRTWVDSHGTRWTEVTTTQTVVEVPRGQRIAEMGDTDTDQVKLHFEIRRLGKPIDPATLLPPV